MVRSHFSEGDYIRTIDDLFFSVKGGLHSDELIVCVLRYVPDEKGERTFDGKHYRRVYDLDSTTEYLKNNKSTYVNYIDWLGLSLQSVPVSHIAEVYKPTQRLQHIISKPDSILEEKVYNFVNILSDTSGVALSSFGISGSLLIGLDDDNSDIDLNVYGIKNGQRVYDALKKIRREENWVSAYRKDSIEPILFSRWGDTGIDLEIFRKIEMKKILHGLIGDVDYFIRLLVDEKKSNSTPIKSVSISATVTDSSQAIYTPCLYSVEDVILEDESTYNISSLKSYRGKFTEQVKKGEKIKAQGTLERVAQENDIMYRLMLGKKRDYLFPL
jgi:predicted nucleotidyltransferase